MALAPSLSLFSVPSSEHRRASIASWSAASAPRRAEVMVSLTFATARRLYQQLGFREVGRRPGYYRRPVEDAVILRSAMSAETRRA